MRYKIDNEGYITDVYFNCHTGTCNEYTGKVPSGYETLLEWSEKANIRAYKIVNGNLVYDANKDEELQAIFELESNNNACASKKYVNDKLNQSTTIFDDNLSVKTNELYITNSNESEIPEIIIEGKGDLKTNTNGYIEDSRAVPVNKFIVEGKSEQETRSGKNKLNLENLTSRSVNGATLTKNNDGSFTLNGTTTNSLGFNIEVNTNDTLKANTTYTIKVITTGTATSTSNSLIAIREEENTNLVNANFSGTARTYTPTTDKNINYIRIYIDTGVTFTNFTVYPLLYEGTENEEYEQYGISPSPDYPSEIKTVKGIENVFDGLVEASGGFSDTTGQPLSGSSRITNVNPIKVEENNKYIFTLNKIAPTQLIRYFFYDKDNNFISSVSNQTGKFTTPEKCCYINFHSTTLKTDYGLELPNPMITKEDELITYIPFGKYLISKITGKNLFDYITRFKPSVNGLTNTINPDGSITITGILASSYTGIVSRTNLNPILINGETYKMFQQSNDNNNVFLEVRGISKTGGATKYFQKNGSFTADLYNYDYDIGLLSKQTTDWGTEERTITGFYQLERGSISTEFEPYKENIITYDLKKENLFDKDTITSGQRFGTDGGIVTDNSTFISEYIKAKPNTTYTVNYAINYASRIILYDKDYNVINVNGSLSNFTTNSNIEYIRLSGLLTNKDLMKLYEGTGTDDYYELVSIGNIQDELDTVSGLLTKKIGVRKLTAEDWKSYSNTAQGSLFRSGVITNARTDNNNLILCDKYKGILGANVRTNNTIYFNIYTKTFDLIDNRYTNVDDFKANCGDITVYYELATPETIQLEPTEIELFEGVNNINVESNIEPSTNVTYTSQKTSFTGDLRLFITNDNILPIETVNHEINGLNVEIEEDRTITLDGTTTEDTEIVLNGTIENIVPIFMLSKDNNFIASGLNEKITLNLYSNNGTDRELVYSGTGGDIRLDEDKCITYSTLGVASGTKLNLTVSPMVATKEIDYIESKKNEPIEISITELNQNEYLKIDRSYVYLCGEYDEELKMISALKSFKSNTLIQFNHDRLELTTKYFTEDYLNERITKIETEQGKINLEVSQKANTTDVDKAIDELEKETKASLELKLNKNDNDQIVSMINASADEVNIDGKKISLANFKITDEKLMSDIIPKHDFTQADVEKVRQYLLGQITLTPEEIAMYDISGNGVVDILDLLQVQKIVWSGLSSSHPGKFEIDTSPRETEIIKFYNSEGQLLYYIGYLDSRFNEVSCDSLSTSRLTAGNISSGTCTLNSTNIIWVEFGTTFEEPPNVVVTPYTTTTGIIAPKVTEITTTGFKATIGGSGISNVQCCWIAIG